MAKVTKTTRLLRVLMRPFQDLEEVFQQLLLRSVETSQDIVLTMLGNLVGQKREGITDDEIFRRYVRARVATNWSSMTGDEIIRIVQLVIGNPSLVVDADNTGYAGYELTLLGVVVLDDLATIILSGFLRRATGTGIRGVLVTYPAEESGMFAFDGGTGDGWGDSLDADTGGVFASGRD